MSAACDAESIAAIRRALELGISWIDTAGGDSRGHSERIIGMACCGIRERSYVLTKCGVLHDADGDGDGDGRSCLKPGPTRQEIEGILERLEVATLDLVYSHWALPAEEVEQGWTALAELKEVLLDGVAKCAGPLLVLWQRSATGEPPTTPVRTRRRSSL